MRGKNAHCSQYLCTEKLVLVPLPAIYYSASNVWVGWARTIKVCDLSSRERL